MSKGETKGSPKTAQATLDTLSRIFSVPEEEQSTLLSLEKEISRNLLGFLRQHQVAGDKAPGELEQAFRETRIPDEPVFVSEQTDFLLRKLVAQSVHTASPTFIGHMTSAIPYFMLPLAKIMMALNQNLVKIETSKAFTPLERQVIAMLHRLVYQASDEFYGKLTHHRQHSLGTFCSGGTIANITALWTARNKMLGPRNDFPGIMKSGFASALRYYNYSDLALVVSERGHYSFKKAADLLGIGKNNIAVIETDSRNKIDLASLRQVLRSKQLDKVGILAVVGIAGSTETGSIDPLDKIAELCGEFGCHFHVDAAWGGPTLFSNQHRHLLKGIEQADSVAIDAHKQLYVPIGAGMALFKDPEALACIETHASYIIREGSRDIGKHTLEGSRSGMAMLVHSGLRIMGRKGYEMLIDLGIEKAKEFARLIEEDPDFELITEPELNLLTYRFVPERLQKDLGLPTKDELIRINSDLNELTIALQKEQRSRGQSFVSRTTLRPERYNKAEIIVFRSVLANPLTTREHLLNILGEQRKIGYELIASSFPNLE